MAKFGAADLMRQNNARYHELTRRNQESLTQDLATYDQISNALRDRLEEEMIKSLNSGNEAKEE